MDLRVIKEYSVSFSIGNLADRAMSNREPEPIGDFFSMPKINSVVGWRHVLSEAKKSSDNRFLNLSQCDKSTNKILELRKILSLNKPVTLRDGATPLFNHIEERSDKERKRQRTSVDKITSRGIRLSVFKAVKLGFNSQSVVQFMSVCSKDMFVKDVHTYNRIKFSKEDPIKLRLTYRSISSNLQYSAKYCLSKIANSKEAYYQSYVKLKHTEYRKGSQSSAEIDSQIADVFRQDKASTIKKTVAVMFLYIIKRLKRRMVLSLHLSHTAEETESKIRNKFGLEYSRDQDKDESCTSEHSVKKIGSNFRRGGHSNIALAGIVRLKTEFKPRLLDYLKKKQEIATSKENFQTRKELLESQFMGPKGGLAVINEKENLSGIKPTEFSTGEKLGLHNKNSKNITNGLLGVSENTDKTFIRKSTTLPHSLQLRKVDSNLSPKGTDIIGPPFKRNSLGSFQLSKQAKDRKSDPLLSITLSKLPAAYFRKSEFSTAHVKKLEDRRNSSPSFVLNRSAMNEINVFIRRKTRFQETLLRKTGCEQTETSHMAQTNPMSVLKTTGVTRMSLFNPVKLPKNSKILLGGMKGRFSPKSNSRLLSESNLTETLGNSTTQAKHKEHVDASKTIIQLEPDTMATVYETLLEKKLKNNFVSCYKVKGYTKPRQL